VFITGSANTVLHVIVILANTGSISSAGGTVVVSTGSAALVVNIIATLALCAAIGIFTFAFSAVRIASNTSTAINIIASGTFAASIGITLAFGTTFITLLTFAVLDIITTFTNTASISSASGAVVVSTGSAALVVNIIATLALCAAIGIFTLAFSTVFIASRTCTAINVVASSTFAASIGITLAFGTMFITLLTITILDIIATLANTASISSASDTVVVSTGSAALVVNIIATLALCATIGIFTFTFSAVGITGSTGILIKVHTSTTAGAMTSRTTAGLA